MCRKMTLCGVVFFLLSTSISSNGQSRSLNLRQPDGTRFQAREVGQCWLTWFETPEGYMVQRGGDGYYHYVTIDNEGEFVKLPVKAGIDRTDSVPVRPYRNPAIRAKLEQRIEAYNQASEENRARFLQKQRAALGRGGKNATLLSTSSYNVDIGILLVEFTDLQHYTGGGDGYTVEDFENMLFSDDEYISPATESPDGEDVFGSMRDYFEYQSHGILQITGNVINPSDANGIPTWLNMQVSVNSYPVYANVAPHYTLYRDAINAAIDSSWNVDYDMHIIVIAGSEQDGPYITGTGFHRGFFSENQFDPSFDFDNWFGAAGYHERNSAEWRDSEEATFTHIGIFAHEAFHVMGWGIPNIFDEGSTIYLHSGSGDWSSMNLGYRTGPLRKTESPGDLDPIARILMEWAVPTDVTANLDDESITYIEEDANLNETFDFYRLTSSYSVEEFIVENRQYSGLNSYLPEWWESGTKGGLLVWRHASSSSQTRAIRHADNDTAVVLEGMPNVSDGDLGDPFPGASNNTEITPYTTPSTNPDVSGTFTGVAVTDISTSSTTMTADLWSDFPPDAPQNLVLSNAGQNGQNPILQWNANTEPDLDHYGIHRGDQDSPGGSIFWHTVATTTNTTWTDTQIIINTSGSATVYYKITAVDTAEQESDFSNTVSTKTNIIPKPSTGLADEKSANLPRELALYQNFPNPFNPQTEIRFDLPRTAHVVLKIYNLLGEEIRTLADNYVEAGFHSMSWDGKDETGRDLPSGIYVYRLYVGPGKAFVEVKKLTLLR